VGVAAEGLRASAAAADGHPLAVTRFPAAGTPWATLLVAGAMGVRQDFYAPLARHLAQNGIHVLTFDYRGHGYSRPPSLRGFESDVSVWIERDTNAMLAEAQAMGPALPLAYVGHSLGGQVLGVLPDAPRVRAAITVTAGSGYYKFNDRMPLQVRLFWFVMIPVLTPLFGYFPGKPLRMVGDLPAGVARQWRRWCLHPEYLLAEGDAWRGAFDRITIPLRGYSFEDDAIVTKPAIERMHGHYRAASVERRHVAPADVGAARIGHMGYFSSSRSGGLWQESLDWLRAALESP